MKLVEAYCLWALVLALAVVPVSKGIWLNMPNSGKNCVTEELHDNVVVLAHYNSFYGDVDDVNATASPSIYVKVTSPYGDDLYSTEKVTYGEFGFTTTETGSYLACFWLDDNHRSNSKVNIGIDWKIGILAKDWDSVAKKENAEGLDLEMRKLLATVEAVHQDLYYLSHREMEMRDVSETTNARVVWFSIMSLAICVWVSVLHVWYLRRYFEKKKLI